MIKLDNDLLDQLGLGSLPAEEKKKMLSHIYETLEMRVGMRLAQQMTDAQLDEFEQFINRSDEAGALKWLESNFPNYKDVVSDEFEKLKSEVAHIAPQLLASASEAPMAAVPPIGQPPINSGTAQWQPGMPGYTPSNEANTLQQPSFQPAQYSNGAPFAPQSAPVGQGYVSGMAPPPQAVPLHSQYAGQQPYYGNNGAAAAMPVSPQQHQSGYADPGMLGTSPTSDGSAMPFQPMNPYQTPNPVRLNSPQPGGPMGPVTQPQPSGGPQSPAVYPPYQPSQSSPDDRNSQGQAA